MNGRIPSSDRDEKATPATRDHPTWAAKYTASGIAARSAAPISGSFPEAAMGTRRGDAARGDLRLRVRAGAGDHSAVKVSGHPKGRRRLRDRRSPACAGLGIGDLRSVRWQGRETLPKPGSNDAKGHFTCLAACSYGAGRLGTSARRCPREAAWPPASARAPVGAIGAAFARGTLTSRAVMTS